MCIRDSTDYTVSLAAFIPAGLTNIISNGIARGEGKTSLASKTYGALIVSITLSTIVTIILNVWPEQLLTMLKTPPEVMATAIEYTRVRSIAMPAAYLTAAAYAVGATVPKAVIDNLNWAQEEQEAAAKAAETEDADSWFGNDDGVWVKEEEDS